MDYYQAPTGGTPAPFIQANTALQSAQASEDAGISQGRVQRNFSQRTLPQLASAEAAGGRFWSSGAEERARHATEDTGDTVSDIQRNLGRTLADLTRNGVQAQIGVNV